MGFSRFVLLAAVGLILFACAGPEAARQGPPAPVSLQEIVDLSQHGVPPAQIIDRIERSGTVYVLRVTDVFSLREAGVSDEVIDHMMATCLRSARAPSVKSSLWYRYGQFYAAPPFAPYQGAYRFPDD